MTEESRKKIFRGLVETKLKDILHFAKSGSIHVIKDYIHELDGILCYAWMVGDISEETKKRVRKIVSLIHKKYKTNRFYL